MTQRARARRWFALGMSGAVAASALAFSPGLAAAADGPRTFALVGSLQSELGCAEDWSPERVRFAHFAEGRPATVYLSGERYDRRDI